MTYLDVMHVGNLIKIFKILNRPRKPCLSYIQPKHPSGLYHWWQLWGQMTNSQSSLFWEHTWSRILCASLPPWTRRIHVACFGQRNMSSSDVKHFWAGDWGASVGFATFSFLCLCYYGSKSIRRFLQLHLWIGRAEQPDHPPSSVHARNKDGCKASGTWGCFYHGMTYTVLTDLPSAPWVLIIGILWSSPAVFVARVKFPHIGSLLTRSIFSPFIHAFIHQTHGSSQITAIWELTSFLWLGCFSFWYPFGPFPTCLISNPAAERKGMREGWSPLRGAS